MPAAVLPRALEEKLNDLAHRVHRLRLLRGLSWLTLTLLLTGVTAIVVDAVFDLSAVGRGLLLALWLLVGGLATWRFVFYELRQPIPITELAAAVENRYPSLAERLSSVVELSEHADIGNGSQSLIDALTRDTARRTKQLNFYEAAPAAPVIQSTLLTTLVTVAVLLPVLFVSGTGERVRRFLLPWYTPRVEVPFRVVVSSGEPVVKRGEAVTLTGYLERIHPNATIPETAALVYRELGSDDEKKLPMTGDDKAAFHVTRPSVTADFEYCLEAGTVRSGWHRVIVVDPVEFADGTLFTIIPPAYASPTFEKQIRHGLREFDGLQFSQVKFEWIFTRPAVSGSVEWKPANSQGAYPAERFPVEFAADKMSGRAEFTLKADGVLRIVLFGEHNVRTEITMATRAIVDTPPRFVKAAGITTDQPQDIRPDDTLPIDLAIEDDVRIEAVLLEYVVNDNVAEAVTVPLPLTGIGTPRADGTFAFNLTGKAKEGDTILYRIKASDNRRVPAFELAEQTTYYPEKGWAELRLRESARPLAEQEILAQQEKLRERLTAAQREVTTARDELEQVKTVAAGRPTLGIEETVRLENVRTTARDATRLLDDLAREISLTPELRKLASAIRAVAESSLRQADDVMRKAANEPAPEPRDQAFADAVNRLDVAARKLEELLTENDRVARDRLDRRKLEQLAAEQAKLAEATQQKIEDPKALHDIARQQEQLNAELRDLLSKNQTLQQAVNELAREEANHLAKLARRLADDHKALEQATKNADSAARKQAFEAITKAQADLARQAADLARRTQTSARLADTAPAPPEQFENASERLAQDDPIGAMTEQEKAARTLDRLADALEQTAAARIDPKETVRQLIRLEEDLRKQFQDAMSDKSFPDELRIRLREQQDAIRRVTSKLHVPPANESAKAAQQDAENALAKAREALSEDASKIDEAMQDVTEALRQLGHRLPTREQRLRQAKAELETLQREQDELTREIEERLKGWDKQVPDEAHQKQLANRLQRMAEKQAELVDKLAGLDAPGLDSRIDRTVAATQQAADDLRQGLPYDIPASQQEARRQVERLRQALDGKTPADELADALAKKQRQLAEAAEKLTARPDRRSLQNMQDLQREIGRQLENLRDPFVAERLTRAQQAVKATDDALRTPNDVDELRKKAKAAADELDRLADELAGVESPAERIERLTREQQNRVEAAKKAGAKPPTLEASADEQRELERLQEELQRTRVGQAQEAKKKVIDALQRLRQNPTPDRSPGMQKAVVDTLKNLAEQIRANDDRTAKQSRLGEPNDGDTADGLLPSLTDARQARKLARQQRELKDQLAQANEQASNPISPTDNTGIEKLANELDQLAQEADSLAKEMRDATAKVIEDAAAAARRAADQLRLGDPLSAQATGEQVEQELKRVASDTGFGQNVKKLAEKQASLNQQIESAMQNPGAAAAQRRAKQDQLAQQTAELADRLDSAAASPTSDLQMVDKDLLRQAAGAEREAAQQMQRVSREQAGGRKSSANEALLQATAAAERAADFAQMAIGEQPGKRRTDANARSAGRAVQQADVSQRTSQQHARQGDGPRARAAMLEAANHLGRAAESLAKSTGGDSNISGGNDGTAADKPTTNEFPPDLAQYLARPWGELPGDIKAKIIQDLRAKYGEDYARVIKLYFEQIADRK
jgi:hypothetical protein